MSAVTHHPRSTVSDLPKGGVDQAAPVDQLALLATGEVDLNEITQRRRYFRDVQRFVGLDIHREYLVATAVDHELRVVYGPTRVTWGQFEAWITQQLTPLDAIVVEMTTSAP
jgi:hypothetical protein